MFAWLSENIGTISVSLILAAVVALIVAKMIKDKKNGKLCSCGGTCAHGTCGACGACVHGVKIKK